MSQTPPKGYFRGGQPKDMPVNEDTERYWLITAGWLKFSSIGWLSILGLLLLVSVLIIVFSSARYFLEALDLRIGLMSSLVLLIFLTFFALIVLMFYQHLLFSKKMTRAVYNTDQKAFETSWKHLNTGYRLMAILMGMWIVLLLIAGLEKHLQ
jgi:hypothetical protein